MARLSQSKNQAHLKQTNTGAIAIQAVKIKFNRAYLDGCCNGHDGALVVQYDVTQSVGAKTDRPGRVSLALDNRHRTRKAVKLKRMLTLRSYLYATAQSCRYRCLFQSPD